MPPKQALCRNRDGTEIIKKNLCARLRKVMESRQLVEAHKSAKEKKDVERRV